MNFSVRVTAVGPHPGALDLYEWLTRDPDVVRTAKVALSHDERPDALGGLDVIEFVVPNLTAIASLVVAIATWRDARSHGADIRLELNGVTLRIENAAPEDLHRLLRLLAEIDESDGPENEPPEH